MEVASCDTDIVAALRAAVAERVGRVRYEFWLGAGRWLTLADGAVRVAAPNDLYLDWLRRNLRAPIEEACRLTLGVPLPIEFRIGAAGAHAAPAHATAGAAGPPVPAAAPSAAPSRAPLARRPLRDLGLFVVGESNRLAFTSASLACERPGEFSPLLLFGPTGVGKTHLLEGIAAGLKQHTPSARPLYLAAEQFTTGFLEALRGSGLPSFRRKHRDVDVLLIDDVQFFRGKPTTIAEFLQTIDHLGRTGRQVVLAADAPPADLGDDLGSELAARVDGGLATALRPPELETRLGIVRRLADGAAAPVPDDVQQYMAARLAASARELIGAHNRLQAASRALGQPIALAFATEQLAELVRLSRPVVCLPDIERAICKTFALVPHDLHGHKKSRGAVYPRMLAMYLARKHTRAALSDIGEYFGRRSHSTVVSAEKRIADCLSRGAKVQLADRTWPIDEALQRVEAQLRTG
jgi:chromosomal replication initiator protein